MQSNHQQLFQLSYWQPHLSHLRPRLNSNRLNKYGTSTQASEAYALALKWLAQVDILEEGPKREWLRAWLERRGKGLADPRNIIKFAASPRVISSTEVEKEYWLGFYLRKGMNKGHGKVMGDHLTAEICHRWARLSSWEREEIQSMSPKDTDDNDTNDNDTNGNDTNGNDTNGEGEVNWDEWLNDDWMNNDEMVPGPSLEAVQDPSYMETPMVQDPPYTDPPIPHAEVLNLSVQAWFEYRSNAGSKYLTIINTHWDCSWNDVLSPLILGVPGDWADLPSTHQHLLTTLAKSYPLDFVVETVRGMPTKRRSLLKFKDIHSSCVKGRKEQEEQRFNLPGLPFETDHRLLDAPVLLSTEQAEAIGIHSTRPISEVADTGIQAPSLFGHLLRIRSGTTKIAVEYHGTTLYRGHLSGGNTLIIPSDSRWKVEGSDLEPLGDSGSSDHLGLTCQEWIHPSLVLASLALLKRSITTSIASQQLAGEMKESFKEELEGFMDLSDLDPVVAQAIEDYFLSLRAKSRDEHSKEVCRRRKEKARNSARIRSKRFPWVREDEVVNSDERL